MEYYPTLLMMGCFLKFLVRCQIACCSLFKAYNQEALRLELPRMVEAGKQDTAILDGVIPIAAVGEK